MSESWDEVKKRELEGGEWDVGAYAPIRFPTAYHPYMRDEVFRGLYGDREGCLLPLQSYWYLYLLVKQSLVLEGEFWECGVYKGASARFIRGMIGGRVLRLFDTFSGMPEVDEGRDPVHRKGDFDDVMLEWVKGGLEGEYHVGEMPGTFEGLEGPIVFAHVDVDIYSSIKACCEYIYPRLVVGGVMLFDDYGAVTCLGAREAVDEYFRDKRSVPISLFTGQCMVVKV